MPAPEEITGVFGGLCIRSTEAENFMLKNPTIKVADSKKKIQGVWLYGESLLVKKRFVLLQRNPDYNDDPLEFYLDSANIPTDIQLSFATIGISDANFDTANSEVVQSITPDIRSTGKLIHKFRINGNQIIGLVIQEGQPYEELNGIVKACSWFKKLR